MGLRERNRVKLITGSGGGTLVADADESILVKDVLCAPSSNDTYVTLMTGGTTVGKFRVKGLSGNHLPYPHVKTAQIYEHRAGTILSWLRAAGARALGKVPAQYDGGLEDFLDNPWDIRFPVASGETFTVSRYAETGNVAVLYDLYDPGDVKPDMPNGTQSRKRRYLHYGTNSASAADGDCAVATSLMWSGGEGWPFDASDVPVSTVYRLLAIIGNPLAKGAASTNKGYTTHLKLLTENTVLFDEDRNGLPFLGDTGGISAASYVSGGSVVGDLTAENPRPPLLMIPPMEFKPGQHLTTKVVIAGYASGGPGAGELALAYALEREYAAA
jgi:hypothetical protein